MESSHLQKSHTNQSPTHSKRLLAMSDGASIFATLKNIAFDADQRPLLCDHRDGRFLASYSLQRYLIFAKIWPVSSLSCMQQSSNLEHESRLITYKWRRFSREAIAGHL
jgi:hypothetical protein